MKDQPQEGFCLGYGKKTYCNNQMKHYFVVYKSYQRPGLEHFEVDAANKAEARRMFLDANIKHDYIIKIIL
jgi:hypothetical protein